MSFPTADTLRPYIATRQSTRPVRSGSALSIPLHALCIALLLGAWLSAPALAQSATAPGPPRNLDARPVAGGIQLTWDLPTYTGTSPITSYKIEWLNDGLTDWEEAGELDTGDAKRSHEHRESVEGWLVTFRISATNSAGTGEPSDEDSATTWTKPGPPTHVTAVLEEEDPDENTVIKMILNWQEPQNKGGEGASIKKYIVEYSTNGGLNWLRPISPVEVRGTKATWG